MKPFDLEKALAGEPVKLRNEIKAYIKFDLHKEAIISYNPLYQLNGYTVDKDNNFLSIENWLENGNFNADGRISNYDIVGMWEEPRQRVQLDLPCPLKTAEIGQTVYYQIGGEVCSSKFGRDSFVDRVLELGCAFATKEDCQEWINASQRSRR